MRHLTALGVAATAAARLAAVPQPDDPDDLSREQKIMFSLISGGLVLLAGAFFFGGRWAGAQNNTRWRAIAPVLLRHA